MRPYKPRRQSARWLDGDCPAEVLCLLDSGPATCDRYSVFYRHVFESHGRQFIFGRGMSSNPCHPQGVGGSIEMDPREVAAYRYRTRSIRWTDLPVPVQVLIRRDCKPGGLGSNLPDPQEADYYATA